MKIIKTTYARRVDQAGRVVIPVKLRNEIGVAEGDLLEFYFMEDDEQNNWLCIPVGKTLSPIEKLQQQQDK